MKTIIQHILPSTEAALWWPGKAVYMIRSSGLTVAIDRYLLNLVRRGVSGFSRLDAPASASGEWQADGYIPLWRFAKGGIYDTNDREFHPSALAEAPGNPEGMFLPLNDLRKPNSENTAIVNGFGHHHGQKEPCSIADRMKSFVWSHKNFL